VRYGAQTSDGEKLEVFDMKIIATAGIVLGLTLAAHAQVLIDDFSDDTLDPARWTAVLPNANTELYEAGGVLTFVNQGTILAQQEFGPRFTVRGRLRFTGSDQDGFMVWFRTDGVLNSLGNPVNSVTVGIRSSDSNYPTEVDMGFRSVGTGTRILAEANTPSRIEMNEWVEFRIEDDGSTVTVYVGDLDTPVMEVEVAEDFGDMIVLRNREWWSGDCVTELDWVEIRGAVAAYRLGIAPARYYRTPRQAGLDVQLVTRNSSLDTDWFPVGRVAAGNGDEVFGFVRGTTPDWLPSHAWRISPEGDGASLAFDGVDDFLFRPHAEALNLTGRMALEAWVKPAAGGYPGVVLAKALSSAIVCYALELDDAGHALYRVLDAGGNAFVELVSQSPLPVGEWTHVAGTYAGRQASLLRNGVVDATMVVSGTVRVNALAAVHVGGILGTQPFGGLVDEVRIWNGRTPATIAATYQTPLTGAEPGLVAYWSMSDGADQVVADAGPGGWDLTLGESDAPDASDPLWVEEAFPTEPTLEMIWDFGQPWHVVSWVAAEAGAYYVEQTADLAGANWTTSIEAVTETSADMEFYPLPPEGASADDTSFGVYRLWGPATPVPTGLVAYYPLDGDANDATGNGHDGIVVGAEYDPQGVHGGGFYFNGASHIRIPDHPDLNPDAFTVVLWVKTDAPSTFRGPFSKTRFGGLSLHRILFDSAGNVQFSIRVDGDQSGSITADFSEHFGAWTMVTVTYSGSATAMYVNSTLVGTEEFAAGPLQNAEDLLIGAGEFVSIGDSPGQLFVGGIDEVRFYNRALAQDEVQLLYNQFAP
jgi:hypothetical protein